MGKCSIGFSSRCSGRMRRSDFWNRILALNVLFGIVDRVLVVYYSSEMEAAVKAVEAKYGWSEQGLPPDVSDAQSLDFILETLSASYGYLLPLVGWLLLSALLYGWITGPWYVRRLHDVGMTGKWFILWALAQILYLGLLMLAPIVPYSFELGCIGVILVQIFLLCCGLIDSQYAANRYGESPKYGRFKKAPVLPPLPQ
ncbi:MAG: DUF805 domain-containing protein [Akkermansia sp.]|nr:DUF805 domain-containing protein [Akkermansia sp.]